MIARIEKEASLNKLSVTLTAQNSTCLIYVDRKPCSCFCDWDVYFRFHGFAIIQFFFFFSCRSHRFCLWNPYSVLIFVSNRRSIQMTKDTTCLPTGRIWWWQRNGNDIANADAFGLHVCQQFWQLDKYSLWKSEYF